MGMPWIIISHLDQMWLWPNQHTLNSGCTAEQLLYSQFTRPFPAPAGIYTASNKALHIRKRLTTRDYYTLHLASTCHFARLTCHTSSCLVNVNTILGSPIFLLCSIITNWTLQQIRCMSFFIVNLFFFQVSLDSCSCNKRCWPCIYR